MADCKHLFLRKVANMSFDDTTLVYQCEECKQFFVVTLTPWKIKVSYPQSKPPEKREEK